MITFFTQTFWKKNAGYFDWCHILWEKKKKTSKSFLKKLKELINDLCEIKIK